MNSAKRWKRLFFAALLFNSLALLSMFLSDRTSDPYIRLRQDERQVGSQLGNYSVFIDTDLPYEQRTRFFPQHLNYRFYHHGRKSHTELYAVPQDLTRSAFFCDAGSYPQHMDLGRPGHWQYRGGCLGRLHASSDHYPYNRKW